MHIFVKSFIKLLSAAALAVLVPAAACAQDGADDGRTPPVGIVPTTMTLAQLRERVHEAQHAHAPAYAEHWSITAGGLTGTLDEYRRAKDYRWDRTLGANHTSGGVFSGRAWEQNANGEIVFPQGTHRRDAVMAHAAWDLREGATLLGESTIPAHAYVVQLDPPGGRIEYVYFDAATARVDRIDASIRGSRVTTTYDDYRPVAGAMEAWHVHRLVAGTGQESDERLLSVDSQEPPPEAVAIAAPRTPLAVSSPGPALLPARIVSDRVIVRVQIDGRPVNLQLDSGADGIVIDPSVLQSTGVTLFGRTRSAMAGPYTEQHGIVKKIAIGNVSLNDVAVTAAPFVTYADDRTVVAGLLGFDFIDTAVLKIDYSGGTLTLYDAKSFAPPAGAYTLPIALDDFVPSAAARIGDVDVPDLVIDTGADRSALFSTFVDAHPDATKDLGFGTLERDAQPFEQTFAGVGGRVAYKQVQLAAFAFGGVTFPSWIFDATQNAPSFEIEDYAGLIGQDALRYFDVYLDYARQAIYLVPNQRYHERYG